ncbi:hypothetical protein F2Q68_00003175 [Brassica cretica]|uniref:Fumarylacetoacetase-like C-terminal domain-containing protein n=1 Tax=Brassica cretica TaxID=69181 RepID=A0A8S9JHN0_BRACR|nr:hypothetical protein F2Q68_00003175 [Brassica cretica]
MQILSFEQEPVIFLKPTSSYLENGGTIEIPHPLDSLYHEVELAVVIGKKATRVNRHGLRWRSMYGCPYFEMKAFIPVHG